MVTGYRFATSTTLSSSPNPSAVDQPVLFTATISNQIGGSPTGTVTFKSGTTTLGKGTVSNGQATLNYSFTSQGRVPLSQPIPATRPSCPAVRHRSNRRCRKRRRPRVSLLPNPSQTGQTVTFTATVTGQFGGIPTGSITFVDGRTVLSQVPLSGGVAKYKTSALAAGNHHIKANYSGDANYRISQGTFSRSCSKTPAN